MWLICRICVLHCTFLLPSTSDNNHAACRETQKYLSNSLNVDFSKHKDLSYNLFLIFPLLNAFLIIFTFSVCFSWIWFLFSLTGGQSKYTGQSFFQSSTQPCSICMLSNIQYSYINIRNIYEANRNKIAHNINTWCYHIFWITVLSVLPDGSNLTYCATVYFIECVNIVWGWFPQTES